MDKLCALKDLAPGSLIEVPKDYQASVGEKAIVLGLNYTRDMKLIQLEFARPGAVFPQSPIVETEALDENTKVSVERAAKYQAAVSQDFCTNKIPLPGVQFTMGCDPEIFVTHEDGTVFPAWEYLPDEQIARAVIYQEQYKNPMEDTCPTVVPIYWDGAQAEFAPWAKRCLETLHSSTQVGLQKILMAARSKDPRAKLTLQNVIELPDAVLKNADDKFIQFRCSRSYNIYEDAGQQIPPAREYKYRCAGGHIHFGYNKRFTAPSIEQIVRGLDGVLGVIGVSLAAGIDNPERRRTYGRAGEFRMPEHGLEYRVLSNFWLCHPAIAMLVFDLAPVAFRFAESGLFNVCWQASTDETREVINSCDVDGARKILLRNRGVVEQLCHSAYSSQYQATVRAKAVQVILRGLSVAKITDPMDIETNWALSNNLWRLHCRGPNQSWNFLVDK